ncbi:hypothetical protein LCGC14_2686150, partial [marine sediment metagenome]
MYQKVESSQELAVAEKPVIARVQD